MEYQQNQRQAAESKISNVYGASSNKQRRIPDQPANEQYFESAVNAAKTRTYRAAVTAGLSTAEREDLHQELLLDLLERANKFDQSKGRVGTFTGVVSEHRTADFLNDLKRDRSRLSFCSGDEAVNDPDVAAAPDPYTENVIPIWSEVHDHSSDSATVHDLETALVFMTAEQRALFDLLELHQDLPDACKVSGVSSATFYRRVADLQLHLRMFGFRSAAGSPHVTPLRKIPPSAGKNIHTPRFFAAAN